MSNIFYKHLIVVVVPQMIFASLAYLSLLLAASSSPGAAEKLADFSFEPPFQEVDNSGLRCVVVALTWILSLSYCVYNDLDLFLTLLSLSLLIDF